VGSSSALLLIGVVAGVTGALVVAIVAYAVGWRSGAQSAYAVQTATVRALIESSGPAATPLPGSPPLAEETPTPRSTPTPVPTATPLPTATPTPTPVPPCAPKQTNPVVLGPQSRVVVYVSQLDPSRWVYFWLIPNGTPAGYVTWGTDSRGSQVYGYIYKTGALPVFQPPYPDTFTFYLNNNALFATGRYLFESQECKAGAAPD
jgi:hypothetical protein